MELVEEHRLDGYDGDECCECDGSDCGYDCENECEYQCRMGDESQ